MGGSLNWIFVFVVFGLERKIINTIYMGWEFKIIGLLIILKTYNKYLGVPPVTSGGPGQHRALAGLFPPVGRDQAPIRPNARIRLILRFSAYGQSFLSTVTHGNNDMPLT
jgi:hypothetical protein